jgi:major vault protein
LERQKIADSINQTVVLKTLMEQQAETAIKKKTDYAIAESKAQAEAKKIRGQAEVAQAENKVKAKTF